ncbi:basic proline-rich protein-like [Lutra lutra]|uniref:basic proline-rich protein-like n=1 Tax=Lutra lutra TaxID=9657 RepID=UPI001FD56228|nr:basic proline-rich protein-like [Lutra lutra]
MTRTCVTRERLTGVFNAGGKASAPRPSPAFFPPEIKEGQGQGAEAQQAEPRLRRPTATKCELEHEDPHRRRQAGPAHCTAGGGSDPQRPWHHLLPLAPSPPPRTLPDPPHARCCAGPARAAGQAPLLSASVVRTRTRSGTAQGGPRSRGGGTSAARARSRAGSRRRRPDAWFSRRAAGSCGERGTAGGEEAIRESGPPHPARSLPSAPPSAPGRALGVAARGRRGGVPALGSQRDTHNENFLSRADAASPRSSGPGGDARRARGTALRSTDQHSAGARGVPESRASPAGNTAGTLEEHRAGVPHAKLARKSHSRVVPARDPPRRPRTAGPEPPPRTREPARASGTTGTPGRPGFCSGRRGGTRGVDPAVSPAADREPGSPRPAAPLTRRPHGEPGDPRSGGSPRGRPPDWAPGPGFEDPRGGRGAPPSPPPRPLRPAPTKGGRAATSFAPGSCRWDPETTCGSVPSRPRPLGGAGSPAPPLPPGRTRAPSYHKGPRRGSRSRAPAGPAPPSSASSRQPRHRRQQVFAASGREDDPALAPPSPCNLPAGAPRPPARRLSRAPRPDWVPADRGPAPRGRSLPPAPPQSAALRVLGARRLRPRTESCRTSARTPHPRPRPARPPRCPPRRLPSGRSAHWRGGAACAGLGRGQRDAGRPLSAGGSAGGSAGSPRAGPAAGADGLPAKPRPPRASPPQPSLDTPPPPAGPSEAVPSPCAPVPPRRETRDPPPRAHAHRSPELRAGRAGDTASGLPARADRESATLKRGGLDVCPRRPGRRLRGFRSGLSIDGQGTAPCEAGGGEGPPCGAGPAVGQTDPPRPRRPAPRPRRPAGSQLPKALVRSDGQRRGRSGGSRAGSAQRRRPASTQSASTRPASGSSHRTSPSGEQGGTGKPPPHLLTEAVFFPPTPFPREKTRPAVSGADANLREHAALIDSHGKCDVTTVLDPSGPTSDPVSEESRSHYRTEASLDVVRAARPVFLVTATAQRAVRSLSNNSPRAVLTAFSVNNLKSISVIPQ